MGAVDELTGNPTPEEQIAALQADGIVEGGDPAPTGAGNQSTTQDDPSPAGIEGDPEDSAGRPDWMVDKFKTTEEQAKAYPELVKLLGKQGKLDKDGNPVVAAEPPLTAPEAPTEGVLTEEYLSELGDEWNANEGKLTDESYAALAKLGLKRQVVDQIARAQQTQGAVEYAQAFEAAGVDYTTWESMRSWAENNLDEASLAAFNEGYLSPNRATKVLALKGLHADYRAATGQGSGGSASVVDGDTSPAGVKPITSMAELRAAQSDERYDTDPAFRAEVDRRLVAGGVQ